jgi:hypothetical protein
MCGTVNLQTEARVGGRAFGWGGVSWDDDSLLCWLGIRPVHGGGEPEFRGGVG